MRRLTLAAVAFVAALATFAAHAQQREVVSYQLDNGLRVALAPDPTVPKVAMYLRYRVGSMNEPAGRSGFAHLFEHLMFSGTKAWPDVFDAHESHGNTINAWTSEDGTVYYVEGVSANLPMILSLEADRMANLGGEVEQGELDLQRAVVKNEMRQNVLDSAGGAGWEAIWTGLFPHDHPYSRSVIGSIADLDAATLTDVRGFFDTYYVPNNAVLALVGDFEVDDARALVESTFGVVPRGPDVATPQAAEPAPTAIRLELQDRLPNPWIMLGYTGPREGAPGNGALAIAAEILGNQEYGFLRQRLVAEKGLTTYGRASWTPGLLGGRFTIDTSAAPGVAAQTLEAELKVAIADFVAAPVEPEDVERARRNLLLRGRLAVEPYGDRAAAIAYAHDIRGDAASALADDPQIAAATPADVAAAIRTLLRPEAASVLVVEPGGRGDYPRVLLESSGEPKPFTAPQRAGADVPVLQAGAERTAEPPARVDATLSNGARVIHYSLPSSPLAYVAAMADGGWDNAEPGKEGIFEMAADMAYRGAGDRDFATFARAAKDIGADISYLADARTTAVTLSASPDAFTTASALLADAVLRPRFDEDEWRRSVESRLETIAWDQTDLTTLGWNAALDAMLPRTATEPGMNWTAEAAASVTLDEAKAVYRRLFQPSSTTFVSVGPIGADEVVAALEVAFEGWQDTEAGFEPKPRRALTFSAGRSVLVVPEPGASQSSIEVIRPAPGMDEPGRAAAIAVVRLLGGDFSSRLNSVIREEKGYSYGVGGALMTAIPKGAALYVGATVDRENTGPALEEFFKGFETLTTVPPTDEELNRTATVYRTAIAGISETGGGLFSTITSNLGVGVSLDDYYERQHSVVDLDIAEVRDWAQRLAPLDPALVVIAGDPEIIVPQLEAIGVEAVVLPAREVELSRSLDDAPSLPLEAAPAGSSGRSPGLCAGGLPCTDP
jgi:zinc protease